MTIKELGEKLGDMYHNAPKGAAVAMIHLFGIKYAAQIKASKYSKKDIAKAANVSETFATEIHKGVKLAEYVKPI